MQCPSKGLSRDVLLGDVDRALTSGLAELMTDLLPSPAHTRPEESCTSSHRIRAAEVLSSRIASKWPEAGQQASVASEALRAYRGVP